MTRTRRIRRVNRFVTSYGSAGIAAACGVVTHSYWIAFVGLPFLVQRVFRNRVDEGRVVARLRDDAGNSIDVTRSELRSARLAAIRGEIGIRLSLGGDEVLLRGSDAVWALGLWLPRLNERGMSIARFQRAARVVEQGGGPHAFLSRIAQSLIRERRYQEPIGEYPTMVRLAIEMAANGQVECLVTQGEFERLKREWQEAEAIAAIADDLLVPASVRQALQRLKHSQRGSDSLGK